MAYLAFQSIADAFATGEMSGGGGADGLLSILSFAYFIGAIVWLFWLGRLIGKNYDFGAGKGCVSVIIAYVLMSALACACSFAFSAVVGNMPVIAFASGN